MEMGLATKFSVFTFVIIFIIYLTQICDTATIGDGTISLYTGKEVDLGDTRGSCLIGDQIFSSETAVPREHPCHYCICYQSKVSCYWKQCAAPPRDCSVMEFPDVCNPSLYVCQIPRQAKSEPVFTYGSRLDAPRPKRIFLRRRRLPRRGSAYRKARVTRRSKRALRVPEFHETFSDQLFSRAWQTYQQSKFRHREKRAIVGSSQARNILMYDTSCVILGVRYNLGEVIGVASDVCMECRCAADAMFCSPRCCFVPFPFEVPSSPSSALLSGRNRGAIIRGPSPLDYLKNQYQKTTTLQ